MAVRFPVLVRRLLERPVALVSLVILVSILALSVAAPILGLRDANRAELTERLMPPSFARGGSPIHLFGADGQGRDILSRALWAARVSFAISFGAAVLAAVIGVPLGLLSGYNRVADSVIMRVVDVQLSFPSIIVALALVAVLGPGITNLILVLGLSGWVEYARVIRGEVLSLRERDFVEAAKAIGCTPTRILFFHVMPHAVSSALILWTIQGARFMLQEAGLSYLGLGVPAQYPSWGGMLSEAQKTVFYTWWPALLPGVMLTLSVLSINLFGEWLVEMHNPRLRQTKAG